MTGFFFFKSFFHEEKCSYPKRGPCDLHCKSHREVDCSFKWGFALLSQVPLLCVFYLEAWHRMRTIRVAWATQWYAWKRERRKKRRLRGWLSSEELFLLLRKEWNSVPQILVRQSWAAWHSSSMGGDALFWLLWALNTCRHTLRDKNQTGGLILKTKWMFKKF